MKRLALIESQYYDAEGIYSCVQDLDIEWFTFPNIETFLVMKGKTPFDLIIVSDSNKHDPGLSVIRTFLTTLRVYYPSIPVIVFTRVEYPLSLAMLAEQQSFALISKQDSVKEFRTLVVHGLIQQRHNGEEMLVSPYVQSCLDKVKNAAGRKMSHMELNVVNWMLSGMTIHSIAQITHLSSKTISMHKRSAMKKLGLQNHATFCRYLASYQM